MTRLRPWGLRLWSAVGALLLSSQAADAHIVGARLGDFYAGALHPLTDLQDVLLWVALGVLAGSLGAARGRWVVVLFPLGLVAGLALGADLHIHSVGTLADAAATLVMGLLLAAAIRLPTYALCGVGLVIALVRGAVNADGTAPETSFVLFAAGLGAAGYVVLTLTMALTVAFCAARSGQPGGWRSIAIRACGSWIAAIGLMMGGFALAH